MRTLRQYPYTLCAIVLFLGMAAPFTLRKVSEWDDVYIRAAEHLRVGHTLYDARDGYAYPPFMALLAVPFTFLPPLASRALWYLVNAGCLVVLCRCAWRLAGDGPLEGKGTAPRSEHLICVLGFACAFRYSLDALAHQQTDLVIGALLLGGCCALLHARAWTAATCFGLAAAMKCTPLLWCGYLLWRRQWLPAVWLVIVAVGVNLLPDLVQPSPHGGSWLSHWVAHYLLPMRGGDYYPGTWHSAIIYNQSLSGLGQRWLVLDWQGGLEVAVRPNAWSPSLVKGLIFGTEMVLLAGTAWVLGWRRMKDTRDTVRPPVAGLEYSVVLLLMLLLSPMSSKPHFCTLLLPAFCLARQTVVHKSRVQACLLAAAILAGVASTRSLVGVQASSLMLWCGAVTWSALFLLVGCCVQLLRERHGKEAAGAPLLQAAGVVTAIAA